MSNKWYPCSVLIGGTVGSLDELDGVTLNDGDRAIVVTTTAVYLYILDATSGVDENAPQYVAPDTNAGTKRWVLKTLTTPLYTDSGDIPTVSPTVTSSPKSICFGDENVISIDSGLSNINGGDKNSIIGVGAECSILGGYNNIVDSTWTSGICAGSSNLIKDTTGEGGIYDHFIGGGYDNTIELIDGDGESNAIFGGYRNDITGNSISYATIGGGKYNKVEKLTAAILGGYYGHAYLRGQEAFASGKFSAVGDAQRSTLVCRKATTSATPAELTTDGSIAGTETRAILPASRTWKFNIDLAARQTAGAAGDVGDSAFWHITGGIKRDGANSTSLIGTSQGSGVPGSDDCDSAIAAQGTVTMAGVATADETFVVDSQTFTWKSSRSTTGEVTIGASASEAVTNIVSAITTDLATVTAIDGAGDTVIVTAVTAGETGNSIVFTEASTNMIVDGSGTLGGTTTGENVAAFWSIAVTADDTNESLKIEVTGETDKTIHWAAKIELVEVG